MAVESMTRGQGWHFLDLGRRLERSVALVALLRATLVKVSDNEEPLLEAVLEVADSSMTYRRRYMAELQAAPVLDLLLADETNPRSIAFQLVSLDQHVQDLPHDKSRPVLAPQQRIVLQALTAVRLADPHQLCRIQSNGTRLLLDDMLIKLGAEVPALSEHLQRVYFSHAATRRQRPA